MKLRTALCVGIWLFAMGEVAQAGDFTVVQKDKLFDPVEIDIAVGDRVVFENQDSVTHNMFSRDDGFKFNLKMQKPGVEKSIVLDQPGSATVRCAIHPSMKLKINVK